METLQAIFTRRSVRSFTNQLITHEQIEKILQAAMSAPSAVNQQPWHFLVIEDRELLNKIPTVHPHATMCLQAPLAIMLCVDHAQAQYRDAWVQDMSAATQNILLAVRDLGLGAVWLGVYPDIERMQGLRQLVHLPESVLPFAIVPLGYTEVTQQESAGRFKKDRIHYNIW